MTRDPMVVLEAMAPRLPVDSLALDRVRARVDVEVRGAAAGHIAAGDTPSADTPVPGLGVRDPNTRPLDVGGFRGVNSRPGAGWRPRRWLPLAAAVAAVTATLVLLPNGKQTAFASWTPRAEALSATEAGSFVEACVEGTFGAGTTDQWETPYPVRSEFASATFVLGERRGDSAFVVAEVAGWTAYCSQGEGGGVSGGIPADRQLDMTGSGVDLLLGGGHMSEEGSLYHWMGAAGPDVAAVDLLLADGREVAATLGSGRFIVWWPSSETTTATGGEFAAHLGLEGARVRVVLVDGTTRLVPATDLLELRDE